MSGQDPGILAEKIERLAVGSLGLTAILVACWSTLSRYFAPAIAPDWGDEVIVYLSVWALWLTVGRLVRQNSHVRADLLVHWLPPSVARVLEIVHAVIGVLFCATMTWAGIEVVGLAVDTGERSDSSLGLPLAWYYAGLPTGMALMAWAYALRLLAALRGAPLPVAPQHH